ncbi:GTP 3',8-cyclase MoaA [Cesiribacter andamanensis]|uniref:GTP 3',8-cyclase n=1 Tax=Cesiribacter andamanensis AMV16 TaxID=1279009 RepID=M7N4S7_9BACT|nr:GTP 3',8-cyclase MoaA [Cesiribacter andamanensis]EMR03668.1 putative molybdopterin cofactor synthesis protein A [Cesiribacter andamanensis AMV16]
MLKDRFNRIHDYLRISLTDSCNFRCSYCMPEETISCMPNDHLMQPQEIEAIARTFVCLGVRKIRLTGGEPLVRKGAGDIIRSLSQLPIELTLTTNGVLADQYIDLFKEAGIRSLNVSLDTLQEGKFFGLTRRDAFHKVWNNILLLMAEGFHVKLNVVVMKGVNEGEVNDFIALTKDLPLHVRFIEFMPFDGNRWQKGKVVPTAQLLARAEEAFSFIKLKDEKHATAKKYKVLNYQGTFAFITTMSAPFCGDCNRMRLTADGKLKNCLFGKDELNLLAALRQGEPLLPLIQKSLLIKAEKMGGQFENTYQQTDGASLQNRSMIRIGG